MVCKTTIMYHDHEFLSFTFIQHVAVLGYVLVLSLPTSMHALFVDNIIQQNVRTEIMLKMYKCMRGIIKSVRMLNLHESNMVVKGGEVEAMLLKVG